MSVHWGGKGPGHVSRWPRGVGAISPYSGAIMLLDFLNPVLDPRITFSRGTNATLIDSTGRLTYAPNNLVVRSEEFDSASWNKFNGGVATAPSVTANAGVAPDGTTTADRIQFALNGGTTSTDRSLLSQSVTIATSVTYVFSIWVRSLTGTVSMGIGCDNVAGNTPITVTTSWQRFTLSGTASGTAGVVLLQLRGGQTPVQANAADVLVWGAQLEAVTYQTTPSTYVATTASAYYGPRFDYDPVTLAPRGLLIEEARTNLLLQSDDFSSAAWNKANVTATANTTPAPDGTTTADTLAATTTGTFRYARQSITLTNGVTYTLTFYLKYKTARWVWVLGETSGDALAVFDVLNGVVGSATAGVTHSIAPAGNGWYRCTATFTVSSATGAQEIGLGLSDTNTTASPSATAGIDTFVWGAQLEAGSFATSYIPTVASTVTRNADVATMTGTNFSSWYNQSEGTFVAEADDPAVGNLYILDANNSTANEEIRLATSATSGAYLVFQGGAVQANIVIGTVAANTPFKIAGAYAANNANAAFNGAVSTTDTSFVSPAVNRLQIGASFTQYLNGHIRTIAYFNTRLPNAQLQTLTAPSLATTLSLDFTSGSYNVGF